MAMAGARPSACLGWKGKCGITKSTISTCTFIKGDGALRGEIRDHIDDMIKQETFIQLI
jgi:hypothetical protein